MTTVRVFVVADQHVVESRAHPMPWWNVLVDPGDHLVAGRGRVLVIKRKRRRLAGCFRRVVHGFDLGDDVLTEPVAVDFVAYFPDPDVWAESGKILGNARADGSRRELAHRA